ncbi:MAG: hypothetical protein INR63_21195 [Actinomycetospora chiangmaiensis]|nr:hypothetical protein [Actinomycetospora chiangmaiensis]
MTRRFTVIQGGLPDEAPRRRSAMPGRLRLEAVGADLRRRLAELSSPMPLDRPIRVAVDRDPIPAQAFLGIRPAAPPPPKPDPLCRVGAVA